MTTQAFKRKLTAILSADVKGYSRLMGEDEEGTLRTLSAYKELMAGFIQHHRGRVVNAAGDSVLAEFVSVVHAVRYAVEIQEELKDRNKELPEDRPDGVSDGGQPWRCGGGRRYDLRGRGAFWIGKSLHGGEIYGEWRYGADDEDEELFWQCRVNTHSTG